MLLTDMDDMYRSLMWDIERFLGAVAALPGEPADLRQSQAATVWHAGKDEKAPPKKERRTHENKRRLRENPQGRANENWRHRQLSGASRVNARISQPGGRKIAI